MGVRLAPQDIDYRQPNKESNNEFRLRANEVAFVVVLF